MIAEGHLKDVFSAAGAERGQVGRNVGPGETVLEHQRRIAS